MDMVYAGVDEFFGALEQLEFTPNEELVPSGERECPICKKKMKAEIFHNITIDVCPNHGVWLDSGELQTLIGLAVPKKNPAPIIDPNTVAEQLR